MIWRTPSISGKQIAAMLQSDPATVSRIIRALAAKGWIVQCGTGHTSVKGGRSPLLWRVNPQGALFAGVDIDATYIRIALVNLAGEIVDRTCITAPQHVTPDQVLNAAVAATKTLLTSLHIDPERLQGIGVAVPGHVETESGTSLYAIMFDNWRNVPIQAKLEAKMHKPVRIEHDMRAMALSEHWLGAIADEKNFVCVGWRAGIGLGIVANGALYRGARQFAGDIGHVVVDSEGPLCSCGRHGCLEVMAGDAAIIAKCHTAMIERGKTPNENDPLADIIDALRSGDPAVTGIVRESGGYIGKMLAYLLNILDMGAIVVGGNLLGANGVLLDAITASFCQHKTTYAGELPKIVLPTFGHWCFAVGAALLWYDDYFVRIPLKTEETCWEECERELS